MISTTLFSTIYSIDLHPPREGRLQRDPEGGAGSGVPRPRGEPHGWESGPRLPGFTASRGSPRLPFRSRLRLSASEPPRGRQRGPGRPGTGGHTSQARPRNSAPVGAPSTPHRGDGIAAVATAAGAKPVARRRTRERRHMRRDARTRTQQRAAGTTRPGHESAAVPHASLPNARRRCPASRSARPGHEVSADLARRRHLAERRCGTAVPAEADETAVGIVEVVEPVEEMHAGIDERRPHAADEIERVRRQRIAALAEREAVERLRRRFSRNRDRELRAADQCLRTAVAGEHNSVRRLALGNGQVHGVHAGIHEQAAARGGGDAVDRDANRRRRPVVLRALELDVGESPWVLAAVSPTNTPPRVTR